MVKCYFLFSVVVVKIILVESLFYLGSLVTAFKANIIGAVLETTGKMVNYVSKEYTCPASSANARGAPIRY